MEYLSAGLGGIGLFLLGMWLITEGLRLVAGDSLEELLKRWTSSRPRGLAAGTALTALLQSSSLVTVAVIGFANAGLMSFQRAVWVIFGSNLGTTLTAWLVALVGFKLKIDAFALPLVGLGALMRVFSPAQRYRSLGMALAGFGILFLGIETLSGGFSSLSTRVTLQSSEYGILFMVIVGVGLTALMMSSSAAMALTLTALAGGLLSFKDAAGVVIGTNIGTTITAVFAAVGATASAKRLAAAHVLFNILTGVVALLALGPMLQLVLFLGGALGYANEPTMALALFHSLFNVLGILFMWPLEPAMSRFLLQRFGHGEGVRLMHLDRNVVAVPDAMPAALARELQPFLNAGPNALSGLPSPNPEAVLASQKRKAQLEAVGEFIAAASRFPMAAATADLLAEGWRAQHNLLDVEDSLQAMETLGEKLHRSDARTQVQGRLAPWFREVERHLARILGGEHGALDFVALAPAYEEAKRLVLQDALAGRISRSDLDAALQMTSLSRRYAEQWLRALSYWRCLPGDEGAVQSEISDRAG